MSHGGKRPGLSPPDRKNTSSAPQDEGHRLPPRTIATGGVRNTTEPWETIEQTRPPHRKRLLCTAERRPLLRTFRKPPQLTYCHTEICKIRPVRTAYLRADDCQRQTDRFSHTGVLSFRQRKAAFAGPVHARGESRAQETAEHVSHWGVWLTF